MKTKNDKTVNTRIPASTWEWLVSLTGTAGGSIRAIIFEAKRADENGIPPHKISESLAELQMIRRRTLNELRGMFTPSEWLFMADSLNGTNILEEFRCTPMVLVASIEYSDEYDHLGTKWDVNITSLLEKVNKLTAAQVDAVFCRVEEFWDNEDRDMEKWSRW